MNCPLEGKCLTKSVIYKAEVIENNKTSTYICLASYTFKNRYNNHTSSFNIISKRESTTLSKYIWDLNETGTTYKLKWSILSKAPTYNPSTGTCQLCFLEKPFITIQIHWINEVNCLVNVDTEENFYSLHIILNHIFMLYAAGKIIFF